MVKNADLGKEAVAESARDDASDSPGVEPVSAPADSQNEPNAAIGPDQAEGLRSMFGDASARFLCLACALDGDTAVQMTMGMAHSLRQQQRVLYVDDIPLQERQKIRHLAYTIRYDIAQAMENDIPLEKAIQKADDNLWFSVALRMERSFKSRRLKPPCLMDRLQKLSLELDLVVLATTQPLRGVLRAFSKNSNPIVITAPDDASLMRAMELLREFSHESHGQPIPIVVVGGQTDTDGETTFEKLSGASQSLFDQPLTFLGWLAATPVPNATENSEHPSGLIIPSTLYSKLATMALHA